MNKITTIIFDYGGVIELVPNLNGRGIFEELCEGLCIPLEDFKNTYFENNHRNNVGDWTQKDTLLLVVKTFTKEPEELNQAQTIIDAFNNKKVLNQELLTLIQKLKVAGYTLALLSNYNSSLRSKIIASGVANLFGDNIFISSELGMQKPNPALFLHTFSALKAEPQQCVFIDDSLKSLSTAAEVGYTPLRFIDNQRLANDLCILLGKDIASLKE